MRAVFFDFDSTISQPTYLAHKQQWAVADNVQLFQQMTPNEIVTNFGGAARIKQLANLFHELKEASLQLYIVSIGYSTAFMPHLTAVELAHFFEPECIFGQDAPELRRLKFVKGHLIQQIMLAKGWSSQEALFIDDSIEHINKAAAFVQTLHVAHRGGIQEEEISQIKRVALGM